MKDDPQDPGWPLEAGDVDDLPREMEPPHELERRVSRALLIRGLIATSRHERYAPVLWKALASAASLALLTASFLFGRATAPAPRPDLSSSNDTVTRYALLLYETDSYNPPRGAAELALYDEYSRWVAEARSRGQFVTGVDLAVDDGFELAPAEGGPSMTRGASVTSESTLSGMFVITARDYEDARALAENLPHLRRGGHVVIQEVLPTEDPPRVGPSDGR